MKLKAKLIKEKEGGYSIAVESIGAFSQGETKKEALEMISEAIELMVNQKGFEIQISLVSGNTFYVESNQPNILFALWLRQNRIKQGLTLEDMRQRLGAKSRNEYAKYEQGKHLPSLEKTEELIKAVKSNASLVLI
jgi:predicted RNase H-like HicB family nuclease/DNA-binding XRE family transcriptional regulator